VNKTGLFEFFSAYYKKYIADAALVFNPSLFFCTHSGYCARIALAPGLSPSSTWPIAARVLAQSQSQ
jgi:hypothetical protein